MIKKILFIWLLISSCQKVFLDKDYADGDYFYLESDEAIMPVWVRGNIQSRTFIIFLHGGPGNTSLSYATSTAYERMQEDYAFVFYDQRGSGTSQGNAKVETFNISQFVKDLERLVNLIEHKYDNPKLFLVGKSWGGCVGTAYLLNKDNQSKIDGWIEIDGAHNLKDGFLLSWDWVKNKAQQKIDNDEEVEYWKGEINWYNSEPSDIRTSYYLRHGKNLNKLNGIYLNPSNDPGNGFKWSSPVPVLYQLNALHINNQNDFDIKNIDFSNEMSKITIPSMVLWGRHDGTLPVDLARDAFLKLGTKKENKFIYIFEESAHVPSYEEPNLFIDKMSKFIDSY